MQLHAQIVTVHTRHPFIIARGGTSAYRVVWVRLVDGDGAEGWGEASPSRYYGETADTVMAALQQYAPLLEAAVVADTVLRRDSRSASEPPA